MTKLYYIAPPQHIFDEMKQKAGDVWRTVANEDSYLQEKLERINIENISDNFMYIFAMFDVFNQRTLVSLLSDEAKQELKARLESGGADMRYFINL